MLRKKKLKVMEKCKKKRGRLKCFAKLLLKSMAN